jgi:transcriptional/translational regulatory protein YebC/TACO1
MPALVWLGAILTVPFSGAAVAEVKTMLDLIEEDDDVKDVFHNAEFLEAA